jgi:hypothetical protein
MKKLLILFLLLISLTLQATTYYIRTDGSNSNTGTANTSGGAWLTLYYACGHTTSGDIIHVTAGTFTEVSQSVLAVGVSIEGDGPTSIIKSHVSGDYCILASSASANTNGNQHIYNIKMDGDALTGYAAINVYNRGNIEIYNCTFINFSNHGIRFNGYRDTAPASGTAPPATYNAGNKFHDNTITNCAGYFPAGDKYNESSNGAFLLDNQATLLIYNNTMTQTQRAVGSNGWLIKSLYNGGFLKDVKIYNNIITKAPYDQLTWDFAIEMWNLMGGIEIYGNTITGSIDFSGWYGVIKGAYSYGAWIHDNSIGISAGGLTGIYFEIYSTDILVERNTISNVGTGIAFNFYTSDLGPPNKALNTTIHYNIFKIVGTQVQPGNYPEGYGIVFSTSLTTNIVDNWNIDNNVFYGTTGTAATSDAIELPDVGTATNIRIRNNIIEGFANTTIVARSNGACTIDHLWIQTNILYNNGYNPPYLTLTPTNYTLSPSPQSTSNPLFVSSSDYHLQAGSPAINAGTYIISGLTDRDGVVVSNPPEIGAYEYASISAPTVTTTAASNIAITTATSGGNVTSDGGATLTAKGVCWNTSANPTTSNSLTNDGTGTGVYTSSITGLSANTLYHVRAYATNSQGTSYGSDSQFTTLSASTTPTVTTTAITNIATTTASSGGNVTSDGGASVTAKGVCWGTGSNPTTANSNTNDGTGTGSYTSSIIGLSASTTYHVRAYATNSVGTAYGSDVQFTTLTPVVIPTVTTTSASQVTVATATTGGNVTSAGGGTVSARGVCYNTSANPTTANTHTSDGTGTGAYTSSLTGLTSVTTYYVRAYAINSAGTAYGSQISFTTTAVITAPVLTTSAVTAITLTTATAGGNITSDGGAAVSARGVCWGTSHNPTTAGSKTTDGTGTGVFTSSVTGLTRATAYYLRAYATNSQGTTYGAEIMFLTAGYSIITYP